MPDLAALLAKYERVKQVMDRAEEAEQGEPLEASERSRPFPPATEPEVRAFENKIGYAVPPSFREFLKIHNGWQHFWGATWITGATGKAKSCVDARLREATTHKVLRDAEWNPKDNLVLGANDNYGFLVFDAIASKTGERKVLDCPRGFPENTFASFADLLAVQLRCREKEIAKLSKSLRDAAAENTAAPKVAHRLECTTGGSQKFWAVSGPAKLVTFTWGRIGTAGQTKTKAFASPAEAMNEIETLVREKTKKGYREARRG